MENIISNSTNNSTSSIRKLHDLIVGSIIAFFHLLVFILIFFFYIFRCKKQPLKIRSNIVYIEQFILAVMGCFTLDSEIIVYSLGCNFFFF
jgi:hypothetical protein